MWSITQREQNKREHEKERERERRTEEYEKSVGGEGGWVDVTQSSQEFYFFFFVCLNVSPKAPRQFVLSFAQSNAVGKCRHKREVKTMPSFLLLPRATLFFLTLFLRSISTRTSTQTNIKYIHTYYFLTYSHFRFSYFTFSLFLAPFFSLQLNLDPGQPKATAPTPRSETQDFPCRLRGRL